MDIALFGATGRTGRRVVDRALARGDRVRALVRDAARLPPRAGLVVAEGDVHRADALDPVIRGADAVLICLGLSDITRATTELSDAVRAIVEAARRAGVRRVVAIASAVALPDARGGLRGDHGVPDALRHVAAEHLRNYSTLRDSGLDWTLMCPVDLKEDLPPGRARRALDELPSGSRETGYDDLAQAMLDVVGDRASIGHRIGIVSERAPSP